MGFITAGLLLCSTSLDADVTGSGDVRFMQRWFMGDERLGNIMFSEREVTQLKHLLGV